MSIFVQNSLKLKAYFFLVVVIFGFNSVAQSDSTWQKPPEINFSGYVDVFYAFDFSMPTGNQRQHYLVNHNRHNEFNVNHLLVEAKLRHDKYRANLGLHMGTYVQDNYAQEPSALRYIYQGNIGLSLSKKNKLWLDVGIFESHIGFEVAQSTENQTLTRSLCAELSPYYFGGAKLSYDPNERWAFKLLALNGWQRIQRLQGNSLLSFGSQIQFKPNERWLLNWSTFVGTDTPDEISVMRYFSNFYTQYKPNAKLNFTLGWDLGLQEITVHDSRLKNWTSWTLILQYQVFKNWKTAVRLEYFQDSKEVVLTDWGFFGNTGFSWNIDYSPHDNLLLRWENRLISSSNEYFSSVVYTENNFVSVLSLALKFGK